MARTKIQKKRQTFLFTTVDQPSGLALRLDDTIYGDGDAVVAVLDSTGLPESSPPGVVTFSSEASGDAEVIELELEGSEWVARGMTVTVSTAPPTANDGTLTVLPGTTLHALYVVDRSTVDASTTPEDLVFDTAVAVGNNESTPVEVDGAVALSDDELSPPEGGKRVGTLLGEGGVPVQIATSEIVLAASSDDELSRFIDVVGGRVLAEPAGDGNATYYLVEFDPAQFDPNAVSGLRALFGETEKVIASNEEVLSTYSAALALQLLGFHVAVNPRIQWHGAPNYSELDAGTPTFTMTMKPAPSVGGDCIPGDATRPCVNNVPALWTHMQVAGADTRRIEAAFLDIGFAPNDDFRERSGGGFRECNMGASPVACAPGAALGPPTVNNSGFGGRSWHGTGVITTAGGVVNNGFGSGAWAARSWCPCSTNTTCTGRPMTVQVEVTAVGERLPVLDDSRFV